MDIGAGLLVSRQPGGGKGLQLGNAHFFGTGVKSGDDLHAGLDLDRSSRDLREAGMRSQCGFNFDRRDPVPARVHHIIIAAEIVNLAVGVHHAEIASQEPVALKPFGGFGLGMEVSQHQSRVAAVDGDGAGLAPWHWTFGAKDGDAPSGLGLPKAAVARGLLRTG